MDFSKFQKIISHNRNNKKLVNNKLKKFYREASMENQEDLLDIMQIARTIISKNGYLLAEMPFKDREIGAICFSGNGSKYVLLNSALPRVNVKFALCHEIYHVLYQEQSFRESAELYMNENYYDHEEEIMANYFAASLMMPELKFIKMFNKFDQESEGNKSELDIVAKLMNYFTSPYMAVLIRSYELELLKDGNNLKRLLNVSKEEISRRFDALWLNTELLKASGNDDFEKLIELVNEKGEYLVSRELMGKAELEKIKANMNKLYEEIRS